MHNVKNAPVKVIFMTDQVIALLDNNCAFPLFTNPKYNTVTSSNSNCNGTFTVLCSRQTVSLCISGGGDFL